MKNKYITIVLMISILISIIFTVCIDKNLFIAPDEYIENDVETKEIETEDGNNIQIKYEWQIAIPSIDVVAPIGEGSDIVTLRNRVGHIVGTGVLSRKYMFSSDTIILEIIHQDISILTE